MAQSGDEKLRLLIVDDEADNLDLLYRIFRQQFRVFRADSAFKALDILAENGEMAIIVSDQRMPRMKGTELLRRTVDSYPDTIRIVLTGYTDVEDLVDAINTGQVFKYITKPWKTPDLQAVIKQASETYRAIKQRTNDLRRALRRESVSNSISSAIRESLDVNQMYHSIAKAFGQTFSTEVSLLIPFKITTGSSDDEVGSNVSECVCYKQDNASEPSLYEEKNYQLSDYVEAPLLESSVDASPILQKAIAVPGCLQATAEQPSPEVATHDQLIVPLKYQQTLLAHLVLLKRLPHQWDSDDIDLISRVIEQASLAISQARLHQQIQNQTKRIQAELSVARQIQTNLLRQQWVSPPNVQIQARCLPAQEVGGDFFEVYVHPQGQVWLAVGDVSGKGVPAALLMASAISVLRRELYQESPSDPDIIMRNLNSSLMDSLVGSNCFITLVLAQYTLETKELAYANAGHIYPMVWSQPQVANMLQENADKGDRPSIEPNYLKQRGVPLGILPEWLSHAGRLHLNEGDVFLLASDGITEATVPDHLLSPSWPSNSSPHHLVSLLSDAPLPPESLTMLRQSGLWQLLQREQGKPNVDNILETLKIVHNLQEDDQTILSMEIL